MKILRPWQRMLQLPGIGVTTSRRAVSAAAPASFHVEDSFTGANGTNLNGWTPDVTNTPGNTWAAVVESWRIVNNRARGTDYLTAVMVIECGAADGTITMPTARGANNNGIVARYVDTSNYWYIRCSAAATAFAIVEVTAGTETVRASFNDNTNTPFTLTVTLSGNSIAANWNGHDLSYSSSNHASATKHGIRRQDYFDAGIAEWWKMVN